MTLTLSIREVVPATPRARVVRIDLAGRSFPYLPGQALLLASHGQSRPRPYSIAAAPEDAARDGCLELLVGVNDEGSPGPHLSLIPGTDVDIEGPLGRFTFPAGAPDPPDGQRVLFIAGGTGIAPLRAMMRHAIGLRRHRIGLLYSARTPAEFAYEGELRRLAEEGHIELKQTVTRDVGPDWNGQRGRIGPADLAPLVHAAATMCFVCGPPALVDEVPRLLEGLGVPRSRIRIEEWG